MRLTHKQAAAMGSQPPQGERPKRARTQQVSPDLFRALCKAHGIPEPLAELRFAKPRRWRLDFAWAIGEMRLALEVQGGLFVQGRHSRGAALIKEHEKLNAAAERGWRVLFCTPKDVKTGSIFPVIKKAMGI